jgi:hypothetical protein
LGFNGRLTNRHLVSRFVPVAKPSHTGIASPFSREGEEQIMATSLALMVRRLAPFVARGDISTGEALDAIMGHIVECRYEEFEDRLPAVEDWLLRVIQRGAGWQAPRRRLAA